MNKILLIQTGGTLTMTREVPGGPLKPSKSLTDLLKSYPELRKMGNIETITLFNIDSTNMRPSNWLSLASVINNNMDRFNMIVVIHGTDTMVYTASILSYILQNVKIPVILTGSQLPASHIASDARNNLINAFRVGLMRIPEILIVFGSSIIRGVRARKMSVYNLEAFSSVNDQCLGEIGLNIKIHGKIRKTKKKYTYNPHINEDVFALKVFPGLRSGTILSIINSGYKAIYIEGYGAGNVPSGDYSLIPEIKEASNKGIAIVIGTQCIFGEVDLSSYEAGKLALDSGAIPVYDMTPEAAITKLMWTLGKTKNLNRIKKLMHTDIAGEIERIVWK